MTYTPETEAFYALPAEIRERAEELAGPIREMTRMELLLAIGRALQESQGWQPIETAQKDGTEILCYGEYYGKPVLFVAIWNSVEWYAGWGGSIQPTHWQPLPAPPADREAAKRGEG